MKYENANLTQRSGYPQQRQGHQGGRSTFLDVPTGEETERAALYASPPGKKHEVPLRKRTRGDEPWLVRQIENASTASFYQKASYMWAMVSVLVAWGGLRSIRYGHASIWLTCHSSHCDLEITPPARAKLTSIRIRRDQLVRSDVVKVDLDNNIMEVVDGSASAPTSERSYGSKKRGRYSNNDLGYAGPDERGWYDSYTIVLKEIDAAKDEARRRDDPNFNEPPPSENTLFALTEFVTPNANGEYQVSMRRYNIGQSRRKALSTATRINSYIRNRRHKLAIRETRNVSWQGILAIVFGLFSLILSLLIGQFWEPREEPRKKMSGPGVRNVPKAAPGRSRRAAPPAAAGLYGRPAGGGGTSSARKKQPAPTGYGSYGGYRPSDAPQKRAY